MEDSSLVVSCDLDNIDVEDSCGCDYQPKSVPAQDAMVEARPHGVNASRLVEAIPGFRAIRVGLSHVKDLTAKSMRTIIRARTESGYVSLTDFMNRSGVGVAEALTLAECGALDRFGHTRPELFWAIKLYKPQAAPQLRSIDMGFVEEQLAIPSIADHTPFEKLGAERKILGICIAAHPISMFAKEAKRLKVTPARNLRRLVGRTVQLAGWLVTAKRTRTVHGQFMKFITLEDETAIYEVTLFPPVYSRCGHVLSGRGPYFVKGVVEDDGGSITVTAKSVERML